MEIVANIEKPEEGQPTYGLVDGQLCEITVTADGKVVRPIPPDEMYQAFTSHGA